MRIKFWGVRGSIPTPSPKTVKYGGNTSCVELENNNGETLILDSGTGIRELGLDLLKRKNPVKVSLMISHTHWDHIHGFPFFVPSFIPTSEINIYGPVHYNKKLSEIMAFQMDYAYFPISAAQLSAKINYFDLQEEQLSIGDFNIKTRYMNHPVLDIGYKINADGKTLVYTGDHETYYNVLSGGEEETEDFFDDFDNNSEDENMNQIVQEQKNKLIEFCKNTDILICDAQYTADEYPAKRGWGHSSIENTIELAVNANVKNLFLFHHEPTRTDEQFDILEQKYKKYVEEKKLDLNINFAKEKFTIEL